MVKRTLVETHIRDGARLLCELDRTGFPVDAMLWTQVSDGEYWRLTIVSSLVDRIGPLAAYRRLEPAIRNLELDNISLTDTDLLETGSQQYQAVLSSSQGWSRLESGPEWIVFDEAVVYRWRSDCIRASFTPSLTKQQLADAWESYRKLGVVNEPKALIAVNKGGATIRFHPAHGPRLGGIREFRRTFQIAIHRAHPQVEIQWLD